MIIPWFKLSLDAMLLAVEAQTVIGLRLARIAGGGSIAAAEVELMVSEKIAAAAEAGGLLLGGGTIHGVLKGYRRKVRANARRMKGS
jgi:hypothetical protein